MDLTHTSTSSGRANVREVTNGMTPETTTCAVSRKWNFRAFCVAIAAVAPACDSGGRPREPLPDDSGVESVLEIRTHLHNQLVENSAAVTSVRQPGIIFGFNDSGHRAFLFAFDSMGVHRGTWQVLGASNRDWESAGLGPCAREAPGSCLYLGDTGENDARRQFVTISRVPEPAAPPAGGPEGGPALTSQRLDVRYPDQPHDVEAMYVAHDGTVFLITKRRLLDSSRRPRPALIYRVPASAWDSSGVAIATLVDSLPIVPGESSGRLISDAALSPDRSLLAVRTYAEVYVFALDSSTSLPVRGGAPTSCTILGLEERQGEGIGWWWDGRRLLLTSEGKNEPLFVVGCPLPKK